MFLVSRLLKGQRQKEIDREKREGYRLNRERARDWEGERVRDRQRDVDLIDIIVDK